MTVVKPERSAVGLDEPANPLHTLARFGVELAAADVPAAVRDAAGRGILDMLGVALVGARQPQVAPLLGHLRETYAPGRATVLGLPGRLQPQAAAFANSASGHVLDYDDCHDALMGHPTVAVFPAPLALGEQLGASAEEIVTAYVVGVEVASALGRVLHHTHYERGWHPTATLGIFGATVASARVLGLDVEQTTHALAIAASFASGIKGNFGTFLKPAQVGAAAGHGVEAALLAQRGVRANPDVFTVGQSFPAVFNGEPELDWSSLSRLGKDWNLLVPGLVFKLYACCGSTHAPLEAMMALREEQGLGSADIDAIEIRVHPRRMPHTDRPDPHTSLDGKFSVQYTVALAAMTGEVNIDDFSLERLQRAEAQRLLSVTTLAPLPPEESTVLPGRLDCWAATVQVRTKDGRTLRRHVETMKGSDPADPLPTAELERKFIANAAAVAGKERAPQLLAEVRSWLSAGSSTAELMRSLGAAVGDREAT
jgi:2-methylcitrate dehydratase PrpD